MIVNNIHGSAVDDRFGNFLQLFVLFIINSPFLIYFPAMEYFNNGQSLGKMALKIRVIQMDGTRVSMGNVVLRELLRIIDIWGMLIFYQLFFAPNFKWLIPFCVLLAPLPGFLAIGRGKTGQRLGDYAAGTAVVRVKRRVALDETMLTKVSDNYTPKFTNVLTLEDKDINIIIDALSLFDKTGRDDQIKVIAKKAMEILGIKKKYPPQKLLNMIVKDYNYLANKES